MNYKQKAERYHDCLKNCGFDQVKEFRSNNFECFFQVPETQSFFNWFLENAHEFQYLSKDEIRLYEEKDGKGHVITDLNKLEEMHELINFNRTNRSETSVFDESSFEDTIENLNKEIEFQENLCKKISEFADIRAKHQNQLNVELKEQEDELEGYEVQKMALEKKSNYVVNNLKVLNQNLSKSIAEFKSKFGDEEKFTQKAFNDLNNLEFTLDEYLKGEKILLKNIKENIFLKFEFDGISAKPVKVGSFKENEILLELAQDNEEIRNNLEFFCQTNEIFSDLDLDYIKEFENKNNQNELQNLHEILKILANSYPNLVEQYLDALLSYELNNTLLQKLNQINEAKEEFFSFCDEKNRNNAYVRQNTEETIKNFEKKAEFYNQNNKTLGDRIANLVEKLSGLKVTQVLDVELDKKKIEHGLFSNKLDKLLKALEAQKCRIESKDYFQDSRLSEMESLQVLLEEINRNKSIYTSPTKSNSSFYGNTSISKENNTLATSFFSNSMTNLNNIPQNDQNNITTFREKNFLATSVSMANLNNMGNFYAGPTNSTVLLSPSRSSQNINFSRSKKQPTMNISKLSNNPFNDLQLSTTKIFQDSSNNSIESKYVYILNQNLIKFLTEMNSDENIDRVFKFEKPISTNFNDNLEILIEMKRCVNEVYKTRKIVNVRQQVASLNGVISKAIEYLYEKDENYLVKTGGSSKMFTLRYDLKNSMIKMPKFLQEPLQNLEKIRSELENKFFINILTKYGNFKKKLESSNLEQLKRKFLVHFYRNQRQVEKTIDYLNSITFEH